MVDQKATKTAVKTELENSHQKIRKVRKMLKRIRIAKQKCIRSRPSLMTRSAALTTDGSLIFVLQANKVSPWEIPGSF